MTKNQLRDDSIKLLIKNHEDFVDFFYTFLFELNSDLEVLFKNSNIVEQKEELYDGMKFILKNLDEEKVLIPYLLDLGVRHKCYGVKGEYYIFAQEAMLESLRVIHGQSWSEELLETWRGLIEMFIRHMLIGAEQNSIND